MVYAVINALVFLLYISDKRAARKDSRRTSEKILLVSALIGPFGAYAAMQTVRHKTRKLKFYLVPVFLILHVALFIWIFFYLLD